jgi:hypothetical protein
LVGFKAKLPNRTEEHGLETPPPAYYFLPFYIDQLRSWASPWNSFDKLKQYAYWKQTIVKYHTGYLSPRHFEIEDQIYELKHKKQEADEEVKKINTALDIVEKYVPKSRFSMTEEEFDLITAEVKEKLGSLAKKQEELFNSITESQPLEYHLVNQLEIAERAVIAIDKDYQFAVENIEGDEIECPLCGTIHDNSIVSRASILADKQQAEDQVNIIKDQLIRVETEIRNQKNELNCVRKAISDINNKYSKHSHDGEEQLSLNILVDSFASKSVQRNVETYKIEQESLSKRFSDMQKELKKEQNKLLSKKYKEKLSESFMNFFTEFISKLDAKDINTDLIISKNKIGQCQI